MYIRKYFSFLSYLIWIVQLASNYCHDDDKDFSIQSAYTNDFTKEILEKEGWIVESYPALQTKDIEVFTCNDIAYTQFDGMDFVGKYKDDSIVSINYNNLPPHFEYTFYVDVIMLGDYNEQIFSINADHEIPNTIENSKYPDANIGSTAKTAGIKYCTYSNSAFYQLFGKGLKHSQNTLKISFRGQSTTYYIIRNLQLSLNICHYTCSTCSGPYSTDCLTCPDGPAQGGVCVCQNGYAYDHKCVPNCPDNLFADTNKSICVEKACSTACVNCDATTNLCKQCKNPFKLYQGYCVEKCPSHTDNTQVDTCPGPIDEQSGHYLAYGLFSNVFSDYEIQRMKFEISQFKFKTTFTTCGDYRLFGGWVTYGQSSEIKITLNDIPPHHTIHIQFIYVFIDYYQYSDSVDVSINSDTPKVDKLKNMGSDYQTICGSSHYYYGKDFQGQYKKSFTHTKTPAVLKFSSNLTTEKDYKSAFGIRKFVVFVEKCTENCIDCSSTQCNKCASNYYLYDKACVKDCPSSYYKSDQIPASCQKCNTSCKECFGDKDDNCTACFNMDFLKEKKCVNACGDQYYPQETPTRECFKCHPTCFKCGGPTLDNCKQCNTYYKSGNQCVKNSKCPISTYPDSDVWECRDCDKTCVSCSGKASNQCTKCNNFLYNGECSDKCKTHFFGNIKLNICEECSDQCAECDIERNNCIKCLGDKYLTGTTCDPNCMVGYYPVDKPTGNVCEACDTKCASCDGAGPSKCTSCNPGTYLTTLKTCELSCLSDEYKDEQRRVCRKCHPSCGTCNAGSYNNCLTCNDPYFRTSTFTCEKKCPTYYYPDPATQFCKDCHSTCLTCTGKNENQCQQCDLGRFLYQGYCKLNCPEEFYEDGIKNVCAPCYNSCKTCSGPLDNQCIGCKSGLYFYKNQCLSTCPPGTWHNKQSMRCAYCDLTCKTCSGGSVTQCETCQPSRYLLKGQCLSKCPDGYFDDAPTSKCIACHSTCRTCFERNENQCETCHPDRFLNTETHICVQQCPKGQYGNNKESSLCQVCHPSCAECFGSNSNSCTACPNNLFQVGSTCSPNCTVGYFEVKGNNICQPCYSTCTHCISTAQAGCIECRQGYFFYNNQCSATCPDKFYGNKLNQVCEACDPSCLTCTDKYYNNCTSCYEGSYLLKGTCVPKCPTRYAQITQQKLCKECNTSCLTCSTSDTNICLTCAQGWYLLETECLKICPTGYYSDSTTNTCIPCPDTCEVCSNPTKSLDPCIRWQRNLAYTDFIMFWVFLAVTIFSIIALLIGFYLDTLVPNRDQIKFTKQQNGRKFQIHPEPLLTEELPHAKDKNNPENRDSPDEITEKRKGSSKLNQIEEMDSFETDDPKRKNIIFSEDDNTRTTKTKKPYDPNVDPPVKRSKVQQNGTMVKFDGDIRRKTDKEVLNIIIPKSTVLNINKHVKGSDTSSNDGAKGPLSLAYIPEEGGKRHGKGQPGNDDDTSNSGSGHPRRGHNSVTYSTALLQTNKNKTNTTQASLWQDNTSKQKQENGRGLLRTFVVTYLSFFIINTICLFSFTYLIIS